VSSLHPSAQFGRGQGAGDDRLSRLEAEAAERGGGDAQPPHRRRRPGQRLRQKVPVLVKIQDQNEETKKLHFRSEKKRLFAAR
jgi:hypothetical protein